MSAISTRRMRANVLLLLTSAIWGFGFVSQQFGAEILPPFMFNACRFGLGSLSLIPLIIFLNKRNPVLARQNAVTRKVSVLGGLCMGLVLFFAAWFQQAGLEETTAGKAAFLTGLYILFVPLLGSFFLAHKIPTNVWCAGVLSLIGLYFLSVHGSFSMAKGDVFEVIGAVFWAIHILMIDYYAQKTDALEVSFWQFLFCGLCSFFAALFLEPFVLEGVSRAIFPILYSGFVSVGIAYTLQVVAQKDAIPSHAALILSLETLFATIGGLWFLDEAMGIQEYVGCALMFSGTVLSQIRAGSTDGVPLGEA